MSYTTSLGYTPVFSVTKGSDDITATIADRLIALTVESREGEGDADVCRITLDDRGWSLGLPSIGEDSATLQIAMGYEETVMYAMGTFQVDTLNLVFPPKSMTLNGNSVGFDTGIKTLIIAAYEAKTLGEIVSNLAQTAGVTAKVDPDLAGIQIPYPHQSSSSGHLLNELERRFNGLAKFGNAMLSFTKRGTGEAASGTSIGTFVLGPEDFGDINIELSNRDSFSKVRAAYWDKDLHQLQWITSTVAGNSGSDEPFTMKRAFNSQVEAQAAADSKMAELNRKAKQGTIKLAKGDPSIRGGQGFAIAGTRSGIDGSYLIRLASHTLTKDAGILTTLDIYDEGNGVDLGAEATDGPVDYSGIPASTIPTNGLGHN